MYANAQEQMEAELEAAMAADAAVPDSSAIVEGVADAFEQGEQHGARLRLSLPPNGLDADGDLPVLELRTDQARALLWLHHILLLPVL